MKTTFKLILSGLTLVSFIGTSFGQTRPVNLIIDHSIGDYTFEADAPFDLWDGTSAEFTRVMYYIHDVQMITSSGDTIGTLGDHFLITDSDLSYDFGSWQADSIESIMFQWGVAADVNHLDPSQYMSTHPLAPTFPSMHWGWAAGYRFLRADGKFDNSGDGTNDLVFEYHMVGDQFVHAIDVDAISEINANDELDVYITAYYDRLLNGVDVAATPSIHGDVAPIPSIKTNITSEPVFGLYDGMMDAPVDTTDSGVGIDPVMAANELRIQAYPNPSVDGTIQIEALTSSMSATDVQIIDARGDILRTIRLSDEVARVQVNGLTPGVYFLKASSDRSVSTTTVVVQ